RVTVAEVNFSTADASAQVGTDRHQVLEVGVMGGFGVVAVETVFHQQLPVGREAVLVGAADHFDRSAAAVDDKVDVVLGAGQIAGQVNDVGVEAGEDKAPIGLDPRHSLESQLVK